MTTANSFFWGEHSRALDERFRLSLPAELADQLVASGGDLTLVKEQPGCLSLWPQTTWQSHLQTGLELIQAKQKAGRLNDRWAELQQLGRLLSTRERTIQLAGRGRLVIPEGFREFLQVEPSGKVLIIGAAVCVEIWHPLNWQQHLSAALPKFSELFQQLTQ